MIEDCEIQLIAKIICFIDHFSIANDFQIHFEKRILVLQLQTKKNELIRSH